MVVVDDTQAKDDLVAALRAMEVEVVIDFSHCLLAKQSSAGGMASCIDEASKQTVDASCLVTSSELGAQRHPSNNGLAHFDLIVVDLPSLDNEAFQLRCTFDAAVQAVDVEIPAFVRHMAKSYRDVTVVTSPDDYALLLCEMKNSSGQVSLKTRQLLAQKAFAYSASYDASVAAHLSDLLHEPFPENLVVGMEKVRDLRYGENPHQRAALYRDPKGPKTTAVGAEQLHGMDLSFVNILDLDAALELVKEFDRPACAIIKHTNPCGCGVADTLVDAYCQARDGEMLPFKPFGSRFGGVIACNEMIDDATAQAIVEVGSFYECVIAPGFSDGAWELLKNRKIWGDRVRLMKVEQLRNQARSVPATTRWAALDFKSVVGGLLAQTRDLEPQKAEGFIPKTHREPSDEEVRDLLFAWKVVRHVKSNAVVIAKNGQLIGVGGGQTNRMRSCELAVEMAGDRARGAVAASDAFFPMPDGPEVLARAGVTAIIQPGGSKKDDDSIALCNKYNVAMVFTGYRHFRH